MEPLTETSAALRRLSRHGDDGLARLVTRMTNEAAALVPDLIGLSLGLRAEDIVLTFVATDPRIAGLDAVQYVDDGPCVEAARAGETVEIDDVSLLDERTWQMFAQAGAAAGVMSTLSLPILEEGWVTGGVNFYGSRIGTFRQHSEDLARIFGAWLPGAVTNADLSFSTRSEALKAPDKLKNLDTVEAAVTVLMDAHGVSADVARSHLAQAAARAGVAEVSLALLILLDRP